MLFSLIIPCYNEEKNLPALIQRCQKLLESPGIEIIIVDNGSSDNTPKVLNSCNHSDIKVIRLNENKGYGHGIVHGLTHATGNIIGWTHADSQTDPVDVLQGLKLFEKYGENILVKGTRRGRPMMDSFFTICMSFFETLLLRCRMWDINAQPTMFSKRFFDSWGNPPDDFSLDLFTYYSALDKKLDVYRFPVTFGQRAHGLSHWNTSLRAKVKFIVRTVSYSLKLKKSLKYDSRRS